MNLEREKRRVTSTVKAIRKARELKQVSRKALAQQLAISHKTVEKIENGRMELSANRLNQILKEPKMTLTIEEINEKLQEHPWYPVWAFAVLTGMRSGELLALEWTDIDEDNGIIRVSKSFSKKIRVVKSTKNGRWRNINISPQLQEIILYLKRNRTNDLVMPHLSHWKTGGAGRILRMFLERIGIKKYVTFHTLRACFATHLLATGAEPMKVMRMGGWSDLKTFQIYIRMAGVDVKGVSDSLDVLPKDSFDNVISLKR